MISGFIEKIFKKIVELDASDAYITAGNPPIYRTDKSFTQHDEQELNRDDIEFLVNRLLSSKQSEEFRKNLEFNLSFDWKNHSRFRINFFYQQLCPGMVIRRVKTDIPTIENLKLPDIFTKLISKKKGLIIISSPSGTGKSTSVAAMLDYKNKNDFAHIITIEDPIEYKHTNDKCVFTQREVGIDTLSYKDALKNALRQRADVIFIGEIREVDAMDHALNFAETGHLCVATLHSNNAPQAISRMINFYPEESHKAVLMNISNHLEGVISQKLVTNKEGSKSLAIEVLLNVGLMKNITAEGRFKDIKEHMEKNEDLGMKTFDSYIYDMYKKGEITQQDAINGADNPSVVKFKIMQESPIDKSKLQNKSNIF